MPFEDFLKELFANEPKLSFFGALQNQRFSPMQSQFFQTQFEPFHNRFLGNTANFLKGGGNIDQAPSFEDFISGIDFNQEFRSLPPGLRPGGNRSSLFAPPVRFLF